MMPHQSLQLNAQNPWPGLATYDETARHFFYGREEETQELLRLIRLSPLIVLYGKSGLGKSSLLQAGLFPKLRQEHFLPVYIRLNKANVEAMPFLDQAAYWFQEALKSAKADCPDFAAGENLWCYLHRRDLEIWSTDNQLLTPVFVFDQFEEVFAGANPDLSQPQVLCHGLADLIENKLPAHFAEQNLDKLLIEKLDLLTQHYRVVLSFREDFLPALKNWERDVPSLLKSWCQLKPLSRERAIRAVSQSGAAILAEGAAEEIVDFVGNLDKSQTEGDSTIEPVLLSLCCYQLNVRRQVKKSPCIDAELLRNEGQEILESYYANALASMHRSVAEFIETRLIQGDRYRSSYPVQLALDEGLLNQKQLTELTDRHRLLRIDQQLGTPRVELIHDRLVSVVRKAKERRRVKKEIKRAWLLALAAIFVVVSFSGWQHWEGSTKTELIIQTAEAIAKRSRDQLLVPLNQTIAPPDRSVSIKKGALIYVQIRNDSQRQAASQIQKLLMDRYYKVPGIETLATGPSTTEVRYFRNNEAGEAQAIADVLLQQKIPNVTTKYIAGFENSKAIMPGQYEIWFATDAFQ
ncbi:ATP-binding protein [Methylicorpusculum sp.]|uniref:LytR C-terminal domain-containing protein n=1 Tax=Methylicorpusculum sp. TaxID=2713644 RepID=UPI00271CF6AF|nr:ATP-binding protein [Methylicorpusculum sp.]MDO8845198.1 ATP-binding protein [Methylicorpusculum sp.]